MLCIYSGRGSSVFSETEHQMTKVITSCVSRIYSNPAHNVHAVKKINAYFTGNRFAIKVLDQSYRCVLLLLHIWLTLKKKINLQLMQDPTELKVKGLKDSTIAV